MKFLIIIFSILAINKNCETNSQNDIDSISYEAHTRGRSVTIFVSDNQLIYNNQNITITINNWGTLLSLIEDIRLEDISLLEAPSEERFRDATMSAELKIITSKKTYTSTQFDHGNPPKEIAKLVKEILSLASIVDKE
jgi:septum formation inhibitor MinC